MLILALSEVAEDQKSKDAYIFYFAPWADSDVSRGDDENTLSGRMTM